METEERERKILFLLSLVGIEKNVQRQFFSNVELEKVVVDFENKKWIFIFCLENWIDAAVWFDFIYKLEKKFQNQVTIDYQLNITSGTSVYNYVKEYWPFILVSLKNIYPGLLTIINKDSIVVVEKGCQLIVSSESEVNFIERKYMKVFFDMYEKLGFKNLNLSVAVDTDSGKQRLDDFMQIKHAEDELISREMSVSVSNPKKEKIEKTGLENEIQLQIGKEPDKKDVIAINDIKENERYVVFEGTVFQVEVRELRSGKHLLMLKVTDNINSILVKMFERNEKDSLVFQQIKSGQRLRIKGQPQIDTFNQFQPELIVMANAFCPLPPLEMIRDLAPDGEKRIELHLHSQMSQMDGIVPVAEMVKRAKHYGHTAVAITDHAGIQAFPDAYSAGKKYNMKIIYGVEANLVDDNTPIVINPRNSIIATETYVVFDVETTGLSAVYNKIIEIGAVKIQNGVVIDEFSEFINPHEQLSPLTVRLTGITDDMVITADELGDVIHRFAKWCGDAVMVAHNASFDMGFLEGAYKKAGMIVPEFTSIDTLELARCLYPQFKRYGLNAIAKKLKITLIQHHRAIYDAQATGHIFLVMMNELREQNCKNITEINGLIKSEMSFSNGRPKHCTLLVQNATGLKNLFKLVSLSHTKYLHRVPRIPRSVLMEHREGLLIGSGCSSGEVFEALMQKPIDEVKKLAQFYDYLEIQPKDIYAPLIEAENIHNEKQLEELIKKLIEIGNELDKLVVATGNVHVLDKKDNIYRKILIGSQGGANMLNRYEIPLTHFRTTNEMLADFSFLGSSVAKEVVVTNTNKISELISEVYPIKDKLYVPKIEGADDEVREIAYSRARQLYGEQLPKIVGDRVEKELTSIIGHGFGVIYLISRKLVKKSLDDGYLVGSRGSVGSSLVATLLEITEVNPLPPHYVCPQCKYSVFFHDGSVSSGYDLKSKNCEKCSTVYHKDGQDIPFETFLGFKGDKVPDIDLNFSGDYQSIAHHYTKELFGEEYVFRAGTISTVAEKTAYGYVRGYLQERELTERNVEIERLANGITGVKRTTGQHPGGIIVIPNYKDVYDFTPIQYPADNLESSWKTTHFDFHSIHDNVLKLDILGHDDPTVIRKLQDLSGIDPKDIPLDDPEVMGIFCSPEPLGVTREDIRCNVGTLGVPEFGTFFVRQMLEATKPKLFSELVQISGLSHGTDVWLKNAQELIARNICTLKDVIGCRDDIMVYLIYQGLDPILAFQIMESVRKGKGLTSEMEEEMEAQDVPEWYIDSCKKIKYMFPKAHAAAYVLMAVRIAYFKVHHPLYFYATYFSVRAGDFDIEIMTKGSLMIKAKLIELEEKGNSVTAKERNLQTVLELAYEMCQRGFSFQKININRSEAREFVIEGKTLIPPFVAVPGLGEQVADQIVKAREEKEFLSQEDLSKRGRVSNTVLAFLAEHGSLEEMSEKNQLSFF